MRLIMSGWNHNQANWQNKNCLVCNKDFKPFSGGHKFCSPQCKGKWQYITGSGSTENQYKYISGNWQRYFSRLRGKTYRKDILVQDLIDILNEQNGRCALSGVELTCQLEKGKRILTNASIDRIVAGGPYTRDNIQLVCTVLNSWRGDTNLHDFINWCKKVTYFQEKVR